MKSSAFIIFISITFFSPFIINAQKVFNLYRSNIPNSKTTMIKEVNSNGMFRSITTPTLEIYLPGTENASGVAIVVCPGGRHSAVVYRGKGITAAKEFAKKGIAGFVLKYKLPDDSIMLDNKTGPLQDAEQAIKVVRKM